jgi:hypothetical protein
MSGLVQEPDGPAKVAVPSLSRSETNSPRSSRYSDTCARAGSVVAYTPCFLSNGCAMTQVQASRQTFPPPRPRGKDQRMSIRFGLRAEVTFCWLDHDGISRYGKGRTRDISTKGVYVLSSNWPPNGTSVAMNVDIPLSTGQSRFLQIEVEGKVVRIEPIGSMRDRGGFAVENDRITAIAD